MSKSGNEVCALCGAEDHKLVAPTLRDGSSERKVYSCEQCGHTQLLPRPTPEEDRAFYDANGQDRAVRLRIDIGWERRTFEVDTQRRADFVAARVSAGGSILDVGAGYGFFLAEMARREYQVAGIEVSDERRAMANTVTSAPLHPVNLVVEDATELDAVDAVTCFHVLEHVADPTAFLVKLRELMKPDGLLVCEVPNVEDYLISVCREYRDFSWIRAHLHYFNATTLADVCRTAGYTDVEVFPIQRYGIENMVSWLRTGQPQLDSPRFQMTPEYAWLEAHYREELSRKGRTDTLIVVASNRG